MIKIDILYECDRCGRTAESVYGQLQRAPAYGRYDAERVGEDIIFGKPTAWHYFNFAVYCEKCSDELIKVIASPPPPKENEK